MTYSKPTVDEIKSQLAQSNKTASDRAKRIANYEVEDTDCALSSWASDSTLRKLELQLELAKNGWKAEFPQLFDLAGNPVKAKRIEGKYGMCWAIQDDAGEFTGEFITYTHPDSMTPRKAANLAKKGYKVALVEKPCHVGSASAGFIGAVINYFPVED